MVARWSSSGVGQYVASERHTAWLPKQYKPNGQTRGVIYCPPKGQTAANVITDYMAAAIVDAGLPLVSFDFGNIDGTTPKWGAAVATAVSASRFASAFSYAQSAFGFKSDGVLLYGGSHGGITATDIAKAQVDNGTGSLIRGVASTIPTLDLVYVHDNDVGTSAAGIETAYGGAGAYTTALPTHSPAASGFAATMTTIPHHIVYSTDDPFTPVAIYTAYATAAGANTVLQSQGAVGHNVTINPAETIAFLLARA